MKEGVVDVPHLGAPSPPIASADQCQTPVCATCELAGFYPDDLDWAEFLLAVELRLGVHFPDEAFPNRAFHDATVAELLRWCARRATHPFSGSSGMSDGPPAATAV